MTSQTTDAVPVAGVERIRADFPALDRTEGEHHVAYFDGPGGTQVPRAVPEAMGAYLLGHNANTHWAYPTSAETDDALAASRSALADFLGASPAEIAFGTNMTTLTFHVARALGRSLVAGDEVVVTDLDHHANIDPWRDLETERGTVTRSVPFLEGSGTLDWEAFERLLTPRTRVVAIGAASNALGTVNDVRRAADLAHAVGAVVYVDAVHSAPHQLTDVRAMDCDYLACSPYKFYGPHHGVLFGREELIRDLRVSKLAPSPDTSPERLEMGTQNHEGIVGAAAAVDWLASLAAPAVSRRGALEATFAALHARGEALVARLWDGLADVPGVTLYGPPPGQPRTPTVSFTLGDVPSRDVAAQLAAGCAVFVSDGDFYAATVTARLGVAEQGLVRAGCACYTTAEEVDRLIAGVTEIATNRTSALPDYPS